MNIDQLHEQMDREAIRLADHLIVYCDVDPHSTLAGKVRGLEVGEFVALFYLIAHERLLPEDALTQFTRVTAIRMPRILWGRDTRRTPCRPVDRSRKNSRTNASMSMVLSGP